MRTFGGKSIKCHACATSVYKHDKQSNIDGNVFHSHCFKCKTCKGQLTLSNFAAAPSPSQDIFCKNHFMQLFKRKGNYEVNDVTLNAKATEETDALPVAVPAAAAAAEVMDTSASASTITEEPVLKANSEAVVIVADDKDEVEERDTDSVSIEEKPGATTSSTATDVEETEIPSSRATRSLSLGERLVAYNKLSSPELSPTENTTTANVSDTDTDADPDITTRRPRPTSFKFSASPKCFICTKSVYGADPQVNIDGNLIHRSCFKCKHCNCALTLVGYTTFEDTLYCKPHFIALFKRGGGKYDTISSVESLS